MARMHLQALRRVRTPHVVVGAFDLSASMAQSFAALAGPQARAYPTLNALLEEGEPELVHVCTPAGTHFEPARQALALGADVYVEKPFVETPEEAEALLALAEEHGRLLCAGHQLLRDPAFLALMHRAPDLGPVALVDSAFSFRPPTLHLGRAGGHALAQQLLDVLPHPLYTLVAALERVAPSETVPELLSVTALPTELHALLRQGEIVGRLFVSLRARPVVSTLSITGAGGTLNADSARGIVLGAGNPGTAPLEKILNPVLEGAQLAWRGGLSVVKRLTRGGYPGLAELLNEFYHAAAVRGRGPLTPHHLRTVVSLHATLTAAVRDSVPRSEPRRSPLPASPTGPLAVVTGAGGFLGRAICAELSQRGFRVRGVGRSEAPDLSSCSEWTRVDLSRDPLIEVLADADVVVHAAAETNGGFDAHQRNSIDATRNLLEAMSAAGVRRLVYVSSISVLRPPGNPWERQDEHTPLADRPKRLGPYTWGKCMAERLVARAHQERHVDARILRPGALIDWDEIELPGLIGRRLFARWHLGLGRPSLPFAACSVRQAATVAAWCAEDFDAAPPIVNLFDDSIPTRGRLLSLFRQHGWRGRMVWIPIAALAGAFTAIRIGLDMLHGRRADALDVWGVLRPRRYDGALASSVLRSAARSPRRIAAMGAGRALGMEELTR
jgi:nucleoside-diphosphate-sugar epimerase/predicted dehydrogenase